MVQLEPSEVSHIWFLKAQVVKPNQKMIELLCPPLLSFGVGLTNDVSGC